jgi:hypothetical protein
MRAVFLFFLLANVAFFAWSQYVAPVAEPADTPVVARKSEPDKLKLVPPGQLPAPKPAAAALPGGGMACLEWGSFTLADSQRAEKALEPLGLAGRVAQRRTEELASWWVFIPPQLNRQAALRKGMELKALGVEDFFVVGEPGDFQWAVSLGVYRTEEAAQARLGGLRAQGVRSAVVGSREAVVPKVWLQVKGVDAGLESRLKDIARQIEGSELRACP